VPSGKSGGTTQALQAARSLFYDEQPFPRLDLADLDLDAISRYLHDTNQIDLDDDLVRLLRAWRMDDGSHPTVGGLVLFGRRPQAALESSRVVVGALAGDDIGHDFIGRKDVYGSLFSAIAQIETFLRLHLRTGHEIVGFEKEKREEIPMAALREAVVNALVHRDYTIPSPTRVFVLSDRVEVRSPGRPSNSVDAEAMCAGVHVTRTPHIYSRVVAAELATRADTGIRRIARTAQGSQRHWSGYRHQRRRGCPATAARTEVGRQPPESSRSSSSSSSSVTGSTRCS
jgi:ATP-dependent DNA helicase RecG